MPTEVEAELLEAARYGDDVPEMEEILAKGVDINCKDDSGKTPLHMAAGNGHAETAKFLLLRGAAHLGNVNGSTPLHWAALNGHLETVRVLVEGGADVRAQNEDGKTAFYVAANIGKDQVAGYLLDVMEAKDKEDGIPLPGEEELEAAAAEADGDGDDDEAAAAADDGAVDAAAEALEEKAKVQ